MAAKPKTAKDIVEARAKLEKELDGARDKAAAAKKVHRAKHAELEAFDKQHGHVIRALSIAAAAEAKAARANAALAAAEGAK